MVLTLPWTRRFMYSSGMSAHLEPVSRCVNIVTFPLLYFSKSLSVAPSAASSFLYPQSTHAPCTALFIADNGVTLVLLSLSETCLTLVSGLDSSGERFISLPDKADRTLQITASVLLCGFMRLNFRFWDSTPRNKRVYFQSAQCRRGAFPPSERGHSGNTTFALPYVTRSPRHVTGAGPIMLPFTSENRH